MRKVRLGMNCFLGKKCDGQGMYSLNEVSFSISGKPLIRPLTLELSAKGVHGIIGQNGSGKSTLLRLLAGQLKPTEGEVIFKGKQFAALTGRALAREVAYLPQRLPHVGAVTLRELVAFGRYPWLGALRRESQTDRIQIDEAMELAGVAAFRDRFVDSLSGGERQRAWIAMLLAQNSGCLLLDEPISSLDIAHQIELLKTLQNLSRSRQLNIVIVLHDLAMAGGYCDDLLALNNGELVMYGSTAEVMSAGCLEKIYDIQMDVISHPISGKPIPFAL